MKWGQVLCAKEEKKLLLYNQRFSASMSISGVLTLVSAGVFSCVCKCKMWSHRFGKMLVSGGSEGLLPSLSLILSTFVLHCFVWKFATWMQFDGIECFTVWGSRFQIRWDPTLLIPKWGNPLVKAAHREIFKWGKQMSSFSNAMQAIHRLTLGTDGLMLVSVGAVAQASQ